MGLSLASGKGATGEASGVVTPGPGGAIQVAVPLSPDFFNRIPAPPPFSSMNSNPAETGMRNLTRKSFSPRNWVRFGKNVSAAHPSDRNSRDDRRRLVSA